MISLDLDSSLFINWRLSFFNGCHAIRLWQFLQEETKLKRGSVYKQRIDRTSQLTLRLLYLNKLDIISLID